MNLVIHDLTAEEFSKIEDNYNGWDVISNDKVIKPCVGCFSCWVKTPGCCIIKDGYDNLGKLVAQANELVIISRYTFGGFSSFVKNVIDRSLSLNLPYFEIKNNEMHHTHRYQNVLQELTVHFYGEGISKDDEETGIKYVQAYSINLGSKLKCVDFNLIKGKSLTVEEKTSRIKSEKTVLLNCSFKGSNSNSRTFLELMKSAMKSDSELVNAFEYVNRQEELVDLLKASDKVVLSMPLYYDGVPSHIVKLLELLYCKDNGGKKRIYVITNSGFYESKQSCNLLAIMQTWAKKTGYKYNGGLAIGAGEMLGLLKRRGMPSKGPVKTLDEQLAKMATAVDNGDSFDDIYVQPYRFPRFMYMSSGNKMWLQRAKANGITKKDILKRP